MSEKVLESKQFEEFAPEKRTVKIRGQEYPLREMSLAEKIRVVGPVAEKLNEAIKAIGLKKTDKGGVGLDIPERFSLGDLNIDRMLMGSIEALPEILKLSVPDFTDWDSLSESETREPLIAVMEINDFWGFALNFISLAGRLIRSLKR